MSKEKILIVDDEEHIVELLKFNLQSSYKVFLLFFFYIVQYLYYIHIFKFNFVLFYYLL